MNRTNILPGAETDPLSHHEIDAIIANLEKALVRRKAKTGFIADEQRKALPGQCRKMLGRISEAELVQLLRPIRDDTLYQAAAGTFEEFCKSFLQLDADQVNQLLDASGK